MRKEAVTMRSRLCIVPCARARASRRRPADSRCDPRTRPAKGPVRRPRRARRIRGGSCGRRRPAVATSTAKKNSRQMSSDSQTAAPSPGCAAAWPTSSRIEAVPNRRCADSREVPCSAGKSRCEPYAASCCLKAAQARAAPDMPGAITSSWRANPSDSSAGIASPARARRPGDAPAVRGAVCDAPRRASHAFR